MLTEPGDLDRAELKAVLERHWGLREPQLEYLPVGFGSHHWRAVDSRGAQRFVTVDDLEAGFQAGPNTDAAFAALDRAFRTAAWLRDEAELDFVVAPLPDDDGVVIRRLDDRYAVTLSPLIVGESSTYGPYESADDRRLMGGVLAGSMLRPNTSPPAFLDEKTSRSPRAPRSWKLSSTSIAPGRPARFAEPARRLLQANARGLEQRLQQYDELAAEVRENSEPWVVTHGEPHRANVIRDPQGGVHLVDWDTTLIAPRERDVRMVLHENLTGWDDYIAAAGHATLNQQARQLYRRWWDLADIAIFVDLFRRQHERTEDTVASWNILTDNLAAP